MKNSVSVRQLVDEFAEQFSDIMDVTRDEKESQIIWFFVNKYYGGTHFVIIYDHSNSLHHRDGMHINLPVDIKVLNHVADCAQREGVSTIYIHNQHNWWLKQKQ